MLARTEYFAYILGKALRTETHRKFSLERILMDTQLISLLKKYSYSRFADYRTIQRGQAYYLEGRVQGIDQVDENGFLCDVEGDNGEYTVTINIDRDSDQVYFDCDCPYAQDHFCKHMVAAGMEMVDYLTGKEKNDKTEAISSFEPSLSKWQDQLEATFGQLPHPPRRSESVHRYAVVALFTKREAYYQNSYTLKPYIIKAKDWPLLQTMIGQTPQSVDDLLERDTEWVNYITDLPPQLNSGGCLNLSAEALSNLRLISQFGRFFYGDSYLTNCLPVLAQAQVPVFQAHSNKSILLGRITVLSKPPEIEVAISQESGKIILNGLLKDQVFKSGMHKVETVTYNPPWLMVENVLFPLNDENLISFLNSLPIVIPESGAEIFREKYLRRLAQSMPIHSDLVSWQDVQTKPVPRLYLHDDRQHLLRAELRFSYGEYEVTPEKSPEPNSIEAVPDSWELLRIQRYSEEEQSAYQMLADSTYGLKRADSSWPYGTFELRARTHPFDFLLKSIPLLTQAGFEIYGEDKLKVGRINRSTPVLRVNITSGIDWFDLQTTVEFGDQKISFREVRNALKHGEHYIKLADGSVGQIPGEWLEKYKHLWNLTSETSTGLRVSDSHLSLLDSLLEEADGVQLPPDFTERRERFHNFEQIEPQPLPQGLTGQLRLYQKHGFDWLYFLYEYKVGGILADDMGLGKTVQVLTFLLSLKERGKARQATLLVVPKSLIANWQRESEKFTPGLSFLEYTGNFRNKDTALFDDYDVVLTTYGTMLRDIDLLCKFKFHYVILDESQNIKNPLAKSARAARLLQAEHRLVMTGTPVENNTFELWSQFAFLNPGLLGNMDYFKHEFATPIESGQGEESAATLRKLVFPFILRRTKEQVAPELPPRTERILYTEMDTAQKRLYSQTRNHYRDELLGVIESEGMNDARFKILEGLLRLRQIAIHPALVEKDYHGDAPKFEVLFETLETLQAEQHKALIFSQFVEVLKLVRQEFEARKMKYVYLDGKTPKRQEQVDLFQNDPSTPFFLISLKAGGVGLNLTAADYVIHLDPWWNPAVEMQASDRVHRIGQDKPVFIYKIIARDTVEEKILKLQEKKRALVNNLITTDAGFFKSLTQEDVKMLFE